MEGVQKLHTKRLLQHPQALSIPADLHQVSQKPQARDGKETHFSIEGWPRHVAGSCSACCLPTRRIWEATSAPAQRGLGGTSTRQRSTQL